MDHFHLSTSHQGKDIAPHLLHVASPTNSLSNGLKIRRPVPNSIMLLLTLEAFLNYCQHPQRFRTFSIQKREVTGSLERFLFLCHFLQTLEFFSRSPLENVSRIRFALSNKVFTELMVFRDLKALAEQVGQTPKKECQGKDQSLRFLLVAHCRFFRIPENCSSKPIRKGEIINLERLFS